MKPLLVVTGTQREGALAAGAGVTVLAGGGAHAKLAADLTQHAPQASGIISFGTCGGLAPEQRIGDMVIGERVIGAGSCDAPWIDALASALPDARRGAVFADGTLLSSVAQKRAAAAQGAIIADMESHLAADAARLFGLPFAILRCISDTADAALPPAVSVAMKPDGGLALGKVLLSILQRPGQLPALIRTGHTFNLAFSALELGARMAGPRLAFDRRQAHHGRD